MNENYLKFFSFVDLQLINSFKVRNIIYIKVNFYHFKLVNNSGMHEMLLQFIYLFSLTEICYLRLDFEEIKIFDFVYFLEGNIFFN
jgi:hypothetical protein